MQTRRLSTAIRFAGLVALAALLGACGAAQRIADIGQAPKLTPIDNPVQMRGYRPVSMPMPRPEPIVHQANSLWRPGARQFFKDQRAARVGDILTVNVAVADNAQLTDSTTRTRGNSEAAGIPNFLGLESGGLNKAFNGITPSKAVNLTSASNSTGTGQIQRDETINLKVAAVVTQVLPNGNLVIEGHQEVRVNFEVRDLSIQGVVRPEDITATNTINHTQMAEARISYGGRGQLTDVQEARWGQQIYDAIFPF